MDKLGKLIILEGGEGAGKSTQVSLLADYIKSLNIPVVKTREPGGTANAEAIRSLVLSGGQDKWHINSELFLFWAARIDHYTKIVIPNLLLGNWVICDRSWLSTRAYQQNPENSDTIDFLERSFINQFFTEPLNDYSTIYQIYLRLENPEIGLIRANKRGDTNRFEDKDMVFHNKVADVLTKAFNKLDFYQGDTIDANQNYISVFEKVKESVAQRFNLPLNVLETDE